MELCERLQSLSINDLSISEYLLKAKTIIDHLATIGEVVPERDLMIYIFNGLGSRYFTFVTTFNMTQISPHIVTLHNQLETFGKMLLVSEDGYDTIAHRHKLCVEV